MPIGQRIQEARKKAGYTQKELAEKIGVVTGTIQQYELGKRQPRIEQIQAIAAALGCDPYSLYSWDQATAALEERINARDRINAALGRLNDVGMGKAAAAVEVIAEVPRYRAETAPQSPPSSEDTDTTSSPDTLEGRSRANRGRFWPTSSCPEISGQPAQKKILQPGNFRPGLPPDAPETPQEGGDRLKIEPSNRSILKQPTERNFALSQIPSVWDFRQKRTALYRRGRNRILTNPTQAVILRIERALPVDG